MTSRIQGSMLQKTVATELSDERAKLNFDREELAACFSTPDTKLKLKEALEHMQTYEGFDNTHKFYEFTPEEVQQRWVKKIAIGRKLYSTPTMDGAFTDFDSKYGFGYIWSGLH